jgi:hypothetical protein
MKLWVGNIIVLYVVVFVFLLGLMACQCWRMNANSERFVNYFSTCNLDSFFSPDFSTNLQSRRHWIRQQTAAEKEYQKELLSRTDILDSDLERMVDDLRAYHVQLRLAGLQKLQQSKSVDFVETLKDKPALKYSCTFTPQLQPLFEMGGQRRTCNVVNDGKVFTNPRLKPTTIDGVAIANTCYISVPSEQVNSETRKAVLADVNEILEAVGEKADSFTLRQIRDLKAAIEDLKKQAEKLTNVTIPESRQKEEAKKQDYLLATNDYKTASFEMAEENPTNVFARYYSLLRG